MSFCYDLQKWTIMSMIGILAICLVGMINLVYGQNQSANENFDRMMNINKHTFNQITNEKHPCIIFNSGNLKILDLNCNAVNKEIEYYVNLGWIIAGISDNTKNQTNYMYLVNR